MTAQDTFKAKAPWVMALLMRDFGLDVIEAAAIVGNLGHESNGFATLQELRPTVKGSAGGYGWAQWTGPRRRAFEDYCIRHGFDPKSDKANYKWLWNDLSGEYKSAIKAVKAVDGLENKVKAFEQVFERAGIKHYDSRIAWANRALDAYSRLMPIILPDWAEGAPAATSAPQDGDKPNIVVAPGAGPDETQVVIVKTPQNPPVNHPVPSNAAGYAAYAGMIIAGIVGFLKYVGAF